MINADLFKQTFGIYAEEFWSFDEKQMLDWLNADVPDRTIGDTISRRAAINAVHESSVSRQMLKGHRDLITILKSLPSAQPDLQWIPVSEKLPNEEKKSYWICTGGGYQCECRWTNASMIWPNLTTEWHWNLFDIPQYSKIVAWMPLPKPWRGEER